MKFKKPVVFLLAFSLIFSQTAMFALADDVIPAEQTAAAESLGGSVEENDAQNNIAVNSVDEENNYETEETTGEAVAEINGTQYATLEEAFANVGDGETITLLKNCSGNGIIVPSGSNFTVDFAGYTYTVDGSILAGSTGYETQGFQLLKNSTIVFKNGTIKNETSLMLIQNYSNLTLKDMTLDANGGQETCYYALSNNNGDVYITGNTSIYADENQIAFDVCCNNKADVYPYVKVTVDTTGNIVGNVEISKNAARTDEANSALIVKNMNLTGTFVKDESCAIPVAVSGGTYSQAVDEAYLADGFKLVENSDGTHSVTSAFAAEINGKQYATLEEAFAAAESNATIKLLNDCYVESYIVLKDGKAVTLDLNNHNVSFALDKYFYIKGGKLDIIGKGMVYEEKPDFGPVILKGSDEDVADYSVLNVGPDVTLKGWAAVFVDQVTGKNNYGMVANVQGTLIGAKDQSGADGSCVYVQGTIKATEGNVPIINLNGAKLNADGSGMYLAGYAKTTVNNSQITATTCGIEIRAGELTVDGADTLIKSTAGKFEVEANGNGATASGAGVAVSQHTTGLPVNVKILNGKVEGYTAFAQVNPQKNEQEAVDKIDIAIQDGTFTAINGGTEAVKAENIKNFVSGGTFDGEIDKTTVAENSKLVANEDGTYGVVDAAVAEVNGEKYYTLAEAFANAENGAVVTLLDDCTVENTIIVDGGRAVTLDLNGYNVELSISKTMILVKDGKLDVVGKGKIYEAQPYYAPIMLRGSNEDVANYSVVNIGKDVTLEGWAGVFINQTTGQNNYGMVANIQGTLNSVKDSDGAAGDAVYVNGVINHTEGNVPVINLDGATLNSEGLGMYLAGYAKTNIKNTQITGKLTGIEIRAGELTIDGAETLIRSTADQTIVEGNGNGSTADGVALAVDQHTTKLPIKVNILNGTFEGHTAFLQANPQNNDEEAINKIDVKIENGTFNAVNGGTDTVKAENIKNFVSGGNFNTSFSSDLVAEDSNLVGDETTGYQVISGSTKAKVELSADRADINANDEVNVTVKVSDVAKYAGAEAVVKYDSSVYSYVGCTPQTNDLSVKNTGDSVKIVLLAGNENPQNAGDLVTLNFKADKALNTGKSVTEFALGSAYITDIGTLYGASAAMGDAQQVNVYNLTVTFNGDEGVANDEATAYVKYNEAGLYTSNTYETAFAVPAAQAKDGYRLANADKPWTLGETDYDAAEIAAMTFAENTAFTAKTVKVWDVSFLDKDGNAIGDVQVIDNGAKATAPEAPAVDNMDFKGWKASGTDTVVTSADINAAEVTADVTYQAVYEYQQHSITLPAEATDITGVADGKATYNTDVTFKLPELEAGYVYDVDYTVGDGAENALTAADGVYTIPGSALTGDVKVTAVKVIAGEVAFMEYNVAPVDKSVGEAGEAGAAYKLVLFKSNAASISSYTYNGRTMLYSDKYALTEGGEKGVYIYFVAADTTSEQALQAIKVADKEKTSVTYDGNVNEYNGVHVDDAVLVYDLYTGWNSYNTDTAFSIVSPLCRLEADVNGDGKVDTEDARAIVNIILGY